MFSKDEKKPTMLNDLKDNATSPGFVSSLTLDLFLLIAAHMDAWSLCCLLTVNREHLGHANNRQMWQDLRGLRFTNDAHPVGQNFVAFFGKRYQKLNTLTQKCFAFVAANDLTLLKALPLYFDTALMQMKDSNGTCLADLIRRQGNPLLSNYIFDQLYQHNPSQAAEVINLGVRLNANDLTLFQRLHDNPAINHMQDPYFIENLLFTAVHYNALDAAAIMLRDFKAHPEFFHDNLPLLTAVEKEYTDMVALLIQYKTNVNIAHHREGYSPFFRATQKSNIVIMECLYNAGADIEIPCRNKTPLDIAQEGGKIAVIELLMQIGAKEGTSYSFK